MSSKTDAVVLSLWLTTANISAAETDQETVPASDFSSGNRQEIFTHWQPYTFDSIDNHSSYHLVEDEGEQVIKAVSNGGASGLIRTLDIDLNEYPILSWRWKVTKRPTAGNDFERSGDDHAARIYLIFNAPSPKQSRWRWLLQQLTPGGDLQTHAINYIWAHSAELGKPIANPYTGSAMMIPVNRGEENMNSWVEIKRNLLQDYQACFNGKPPRLSAIAIMTDTDNSQSSATAYYGDITLSKDGVE